MPIYEYRCKSCQHTFSRLRSVAAGHDTVSCPRCGEEQVERLLSSFASTGSHSRAGSTSPPSCGAFT